MLVLKYLKKKKFQWQASLLEEDEDIDIWSHHPPSFSPLLGQKKKVTPLVSVVTWWGVKADMDNVHR